MRSHTIVGLVVLIAAVAAVAAVVSRPAIAPIASPAASTFDPKLVKRGRTLALIGDCGVCHTAAGGPAFAGGRAIPTPFGTIYARNITPDVQTGLGAWSQAAFARAMREGVSRSGTFIYPAHPYDHFTRLTDTDVAALYAFIMTRPAVVAATPTPSLRFPFNQRALLAGWNLLFLDDRRYQSDPAHSEEWNRGAYLTEGLGHCGACHTPRNLFGAERTDRMLAGGTAEGWDAPALDASSPALVAWTRAGLITYLRTGREAEHGIAGGPMADVAQDLSAVPQADIEAIATYLASLMGEPSAARAARARALIDRTERDALERWRALANEQISELGEIVYATSCAQCHEPWTTDPPQNAGRNLALQTAVVAPEPVNLIRTILDGIHPLDTPSRTIMPAFAGAFTDRQIAALVRYLRRTFSDLPAWTDVDAAVARQRARGA